MQQKRTTMLIPDDLKFSDLQLKVETDGQITFEWKPIERICEANDIPFEALRDSPADNAARLINAWYVAHRQNGGAPEPAYEGLIAEARAEEAAGQPFSYEPGRG